MKNRPIEPPPPGTPPAPCFDLRCCGSASAARGPRSRLTLAALLLVFAAPFAAAWLFAGHPEWLPAARANRGELIEPPAPFAPGPLTGWDGRPLSDQLWRDRWLLVIARRECDQECREALWKLRQVRLALGPQREQVARLLLLEEAPPPELAGLIEQEFAGTATAALASAPALAARAEGIFLVDPFGNLILRYPAQAPGQDLLKDLTRLLKATEHRGNHARG